jgi:hypothetical protein
MIYGIPAGLHGQSCALKDQVGRVCGAPAGDRRDHLMKRNRPPIGVQSAGG